MSLFPSDEDATATQFRLLSRWVQDPPESVLVKMNPLDTTATSLFPSDEDATAPQFRLPLLVHCQLAPESPLV